MKGHLTLRPRFSPVNYTALGLIPPMEGEAPLEHYQQGVAVSGELVFDGASHAIDAGRSLPGSWSPAG